MWPSTAGSVLIIVRPFFTARYVGAPLHEMRLQCGQAWLGFTTKPGQYHCNTPNDTLGGVADHLLAIVLTMLLMMLMMLILLRLMVTVAVVM
eukprot:8147918-Alexandrium_andersonii.AAC.1